MIEYRIRLTKGRSKRIVDMAEKTGYDDEPSFLQDIINALADDREVGKEIAEWLRG